MAEAKTVNLTSPERVLYPEDGITKGDLFHYYEQVGPTIVPHLKDRPFTMKRYPHGITEQAFFQKQAPKHLPSWIPTRQFRTWPREGDSRLVDFALVNSTEAVLFMVQNNCIDMNAWYSRVDKPDRPDFVLFDLDPPDDGFELAIEVAHLIRELLDELGLPGYVKTSGADGIHVVAPITRRSTFRQTYDFAEGASRLLEQRHPGKVTTEWLKKKRDGVLVDHRQNGHGKTIASALLGATQAGGAGLHAAALGGAHIRRAAARLHHGEGSRPDRGARRPVHARAGGSTPACSGRESPGKARLGLVNREEIMRALEGVIDPELRRPVTELDMVRDIEIDGGDVRVTIALTVAGCPLRDSFKDQVADVMKDVPGVERVAVGFDVMTAEERQALTTKLRGGLQERSKGLSLDVSTRVIAVCSGKGGVGKSTLAANLAVAFSQQGNRVGVLDADVYGHSIPHILGIHQKPVLVDKMIVPPVRHDLKLMSIGFFLDDNQPVMWRGPMLHRALEQFLSDVHWGDLDVLVVDMPPGTGDVAISLGQLLPRAETVVVTTPQPAAQEVASRAGVMAQKTGMRLIGVVENMTGDVFGSGGGQRLAEELEVPLLGRVPLDPLLRECGDAGEPLLSAPQDSETGAELRRIADAILALQRGSIVKPLTVVST